METEWLRTFLIAAKTENFSETAEKRFITQSTVTKHIHHLEKELNTPLFERSGKKVRLNMVGAYFSDKAEKIINALDDALKGTHAFLDGYTSQLTIGVSPQIANSTLPQIIEHFREHKSHIQLSIDILKSNKIGEAVYRGLIDIGLSKLSSVRDLQIHMIADEAIQLIVPPSKKDIDTIELLTNEPILTHEFSPYWENIQHLLSNQYPSHKTMKLDQTEVIKNFVKQGLGIAFLPQSIVQKETEGGTLAIHYVDECKNISSQTYFISKYISNDIQSFLESSKIIYKGISNK